MTVRKKILTTIIGSIVVIGSILGVAGFIYGIQASKDRLPEEVVDVFQDELIKRGVERVGQPIEGFNAQAFTNAFPGLILPDFNAVQANEGIYSFTDGDLIFERTKSQPITSAESTISKEGYETLLKNLSSRLNMPASTAEEVIVIVDEIDLPADVAEHISSKKDLIIAHQPRPLSVISSPLEVIGMARGTWFFEADFQLTLVDWDGRIIAESYATAQNDWMTEKFIPFEGTIEFEPPEDIGEFSNQGTLILQKANPSGLPENADALEIPVRFR